MPHTIIVIPCFNESERLPVDEFVSFCRSDNSIEFLFVNDGSTDATSERLKELQSLNPSAFRILELPINQGKGEAVRQGVLASLDRKADFIGYWDADLATPLSEIPEFLAMFEAHPQLEIVIGARVKLIGRKIERQLLRHILGRISATMISLTLRLGIYDSQCGAKMFKLSDELRQAFAKPFRSRWIFDVEILARYQSLLRRQAKMIENHLYELPLRQWIDVSGSKVKPFDFFVALRDVLEIYRRYRRDN